jgi:hypothetical protein
MIQKERGGRTMSKITDTIKALPGLCVSEPTANISEDISNAEEELELRFAEEYKEYVSSFGAVSCDRLELTGISKNSENDVIDMTFMNRDTNPEIPNDLYVIEDTAIGGIVFWQDASGTVYLTEYDSAPEIVASSLVEYLTDFKECFKDDND